MKSGDISSETENNNDSINSFSYAEDCAIYIEGEPGVKTSGFVNTTETGVNRDNVTIIAKQECTIEYIDTLPPPAEAGDSCSWFSDHCHGITHGLTRSPRA